MIGGELARTGTNARSRTASGRIRVRTRWLYSDSSDCIDCPGRHAYARGGNVTSSDWPQMFDGDGHLTAHVHRAVASFGDDVDLVITVQRADEPSDAEESAYAAGVAAERLHQVQAIVAGALSELSSEDRKRVLRWIEGRARDDA